jgi:hypothetical protein
MRPTSLLKALAPKALAPLFLSAFLAGCGGATASEHQAPSEGASFGPDVAPFLQMTTEGRSRTVTSSKSYLDTKTNRLWVNASVARVGYPDESLWIVFPAGTVGEFPCDDEHGVSYFEHGEGDGVFHALTTNADLPSLLSVRNAGDVGSFVDGSFSGQLLYRDPADATAAPEVVLATIEFHVKRSANR